MAAAVNVIEEFEIEEDESIAPEGNRKWECVLIHSLNFIALVLALISISQVLVPNGEESSQKRITAIIPFGVVQQSYHNMRTDNKIKLVAKADCPVTAHKTIGTTAKLPDFPTFANTDHVEKQLNTTHLLSSDHLRGISIVHDGLIIQYSGVYYIYSSLLFKVHTDLTSAQFAYQNWFHYVHRISPNSPMDSGVILRSVYTACPNCSRIEDTSFTGGIFKLKAGDIIKVCLAGDGITEDNPTTSSVGLFMLYSTS